MVSSSFTALSPEYASFQIGEWTYGSPQVLSWGEGATLKIGRFCSIAEDVVIFLGGEHRTDWIATYPFSVFFPEAKAISGHPKTKGDVIIGNDVWIARGVRILSGVKIGNGAVIGAGSVVAKDIPPYAIIVGNPSRILRYRFPPDIVERLERLQWWDWDYDKIVSALQLLQSSNTTSFLETYEP